MDGASSKPPSARRRRKKIETATVPLKRAEDGSGFIRCKGCGADIPAGTFDMDSCILDSDIKNTLESEVTNPSSNGKGMEGKKARDPNAPKHPRENFRKEYKEAHPGAKGGAMVAKAGGDRWKSMTVEEKKVYVDRDAELKKAYKKAMEKYNSEKENAESGNRG